VQWDIHGLKDDRQMANEDSSGHSVANGVFAAKGRGYRIRCRKLDAERRSTRRNVLTPGFGQQKIVALTSRTTPSASGAISRL
jgi:hypothetical protein